MKVKRILRRSKGIISLFLALSLCVSMPSAVSADEITDIEEINILTEENTDDTDVQVEADVPETESVPESGIVSGDGDISDTENATETVSASSEEQITAEGTAITEAEAAEEEEETLPDIQEVVSEYSQEAAVQEVLPYELSGYEAQTYEQDTLFTYYYGEYPINAWPDEDGVYYFFVPSDADLSAFSFETAAVPASVSAGEITEGNIVSADMSENDTLTVTFEDGSEYTVTVMQSSIPSVTIDITDSDLETLNGGSKDEKYASLVSYNSDICPLDNVTAEIKGRGNTSWAMAKKGYQIKFSKKQNMLGTEKAKKWLLIPNYCDGSMLKSPLTYDFAAGMGMEGAVDFDFADLWIDGQYLGTYTLCEKVEIGEGRVDISDDGVLVEMDEATYASETYYQSTASGYHYVLKDPDAEDEGALDNFANFETRMTAFENALYKGADWAAVSSYIDVESFIRYYFTCEFAKNDEAYVTGLFYYMDGADDVIHCGPAWDFDTAYGQSQSLAPTSGDLFDKSTPFPMDVLRWLTEYPEFYRQMTELWQNEYSDIIAESVEKLHVWEENIASSADMNYIRWDVLGGSNPKGSGLKKFEETFAANVEVLYDWCVGRLQYMDSRYVWSDSTGVKVNGIYIPNLNSSKIIAGADVSAPEGTIVKYRWWLYSYEEARWLSWSQWFTDNWYKVPLTKSGKYKLRVEAKTLASLSYESSCEVDFTYNTDEIKLSGIYIPNKIGYALNASAVASSPSALEYNWWIYDCSKGYWVYSSGWKESASLYWKGITTGTFWVQVQVRIKNSDANVVTSIQTINFEKVEEGLKYGIVNIDGTDYLYKTTGEPYGAGTPSYDGKKYWTDSDGKLKSGWLTLGSYKLYFDPDTYAACTDGVYTIGGEKYLFDKNGILYRNATPNINGKKYYCTSTGALKSGWLYLGVWKMYFDPNTYTAAIGFMQINGKMYLFDNNGVMQNYAGTTIINGSKYWFSTDDASLKTGWLDLNGMKLYFDPATYAAYVNTTATIDGVLYSFDSNGLASVWTENSSRNTPSGSRYEYNSSFEEEGWDW